MHTIFVSDHDVTAAGVPLNDTVDEPWVKPKYRPEIETEMPTIPEDGVSALMRGGFGFAEQLASLPPSVARHVQVQGPEPETVDGVP